MEVLKTLVIAQEDITGQSPKEFQHLIATRRGMDNGDQSGQRNRRKRSKVEASGKPNEIIVSKKEKSLLYKAKRQDEMQTEKYSLVRFTFKGVLFKILVTWWEQFQWNGRNRKLRGE